MNHRFLRNIKRQNLISEGSCDTEDWINGCLKFSFCQINNNFFFKYIQIENNCFK